MNATERQGFWQWLNALTPITEQAARLVYVPIHYLYALLHWWSNYLGDAFLSNRAFRWGVIVFCCLYLLWKTYTAVMWLCKLQSGKHRSTQCNIKYRTGQYPQTKTTASTRDNKENTKRPTPDPSNSVAIATRIEVITPKIRVCTKRCTQFFKKMSIRPFANSSGLIKRTLSRIRRPKTTLTKREAR